MLRQHCTHTCLCKGAAASYADARRGDCRTEHPRLTTHTNYREGHGDLSPACSGILCVRETTMWSVLHDGVHVDLDENAGTRKPIDDQPGPHRKDTLEGLAHYPIDWLPIGTIGDIDGDFTYIGEAASGFFEQGLDVLHGLGRLGGSIAIAHELAIQGTPGLAPQIDTLASAYGHAELAAQILAIFVLLTGLEATQTLVRCAMGAGDG